MKNIKFIVVFIAGLSVTVFGAYAATIQADINSFTQYIQSFFVTTDGTPSGDPFLHINGNGKTAIMQDDNYAFMFRDQSIVPIDIVWSIYQDEETILVNGVSDMALLWAINQTQWDVVNISTRIDDKVLAMMEYESSSDQNTETQIQHQVRVEESWTTISFDDHDVLGYHTVLGLWSYGLNMFSSLGWNILSVSREWILSLKNYSFPIDDWQANQVLTTNGNGQLSWTNASVNGQVVSSINGQIGDLWLTTDDLIQWEENGYIKTKKTTLTANDIKNLDTNRIELVPSPWVGKIIELVQIIYSYNAGTEAFNFNCSNDRISIVFTNEWTTEISSAGCSLTNGMNTLDSFKIFGYSNMMPLVSEEDWLSAKMDSTPSEWDGTLDIYVAYRERAL